MKKLLIASTALSLAGGAAFAEITVSGDAEMGVDYNSEAGEGMSKHSFVHEVGIDFSGSGTTDGGLSFGGSAGFDTGDDVVNTGTVHVSGSFGTLTIGDNDAADLTAGGIADIGLNGIGVDDMVEDLRGGTAAALRYDNSFGQISISISAGTKDGMAAVAGRDPSPASAATEYYLTGADNVKRTFDSAEPSDAQYDSAFGIFRTISTDTATLGDVTAVSNLSVDALGVRTAGTDGVITNFGYQTDADGEFVLDDDDNMVVVSNPNAAADAQSPVTNTTQLATFNNYVMAYDLGEDGAVGGTGDDADMMKEGVVTDNAMAEGEMDMGMAEVPAVKSKTQYAFGMSFEAGGVTIGVGYDSEKTVSMGAGFTTGEISTNLLFVKTADDKDMDGDQSRTGMGADMSYSMGASTVTLAYGRDKPKEGKAMDAVGMGVTHDLGGGATMNAGFGKVGESNKASIGLSFAF